MNIRHTLNNGIVLLLPFIMGGAMLGYLDFMSVAFILLVYLTTISRLEQSISFAVILPPLFGWLFQYYEIALPGALFSVLIGYLFLNRDIVTIVRTPIWNRWKYIIPIIIIFVAYYIFTGKTANSTTKIVGLFITVSYTPFFMLLAQDKKVSVSNLAPVFFFYGLLMMLIGYDYLGYSKPTGLFDFIAFRQGGSYNARLDELHINYQLVGNAGLLGISFLLSVYNRIKTLNIISIISACVWLILASGSRQSIIGLALLIVLWMLLRSDKLNIWSILFSIILIIVFYIFLSQLNIEFINVLFDKSQPMENNIGRNFDYAYIIIEKEWLTGIGFGNYLNPVTEEIYPHNIILELICEIGVVGIVFLLIPIIFYLSNNKVSWRDRFSNGALAVIVYFPYLNRAMISDDISRNIVVITLFFVFFSPKSTFKKLSFR